MAAQSPSSRPGAMATTGGDGAAVATAAHSASDSGGGGGGGGSGPGSEKLKRIGDWIFGETLGQGSFGKVKLAHHAKTKEKVAIKIVDKSGIANVEDVERVYRETFILTTLKHPNIIKLFEVLDTPRSIMLVMEYAGGGELFSYVAAKHRLGEVESCRLFQQIISGVEYCHRAKIIHRDLKLENILLDKSGQVKIADFGLSNSIKFGQKMDTSCLTGDHHVLELHRGWLPISEASPGDMVWSLGFLGARTAGWARVTATVVRPLAPGEPLVHFTSAAAAGTDAAGHAPTDLLVTLDHQMWTLDPSTRAWASTAAAEVAPGRHVLTSAPALDAQEYRWDLPFLPAAALSSPCVSQLDEAWCEFLGLFLGCGRLAMEGLAQQGYSDDAKCVVLRASAQVQAQAQAQGALAKRVDAVLTRLGWLPLCDGDVAASSAGQPRFHRLADSFVANHAGLYDFLWPMLASSPVCGATAAPAPLPLAAEYLTNLAREDAAAEEEEWKGRQRKAIDDASEVLPPPPQQNDAIAAAVQAHPASAQLRKWGRRRLLQMSDPCDAAAVTPAHAVAAVPVAAAAASAAASPSPSHPPDLVALFGGVAALVHEVERERGGAHPHPSPAATRPIVHRILAPDAIEPLVSNEPVRLLLQLRARTPRTFSALGRSLRDAGVRTGTHLALAELVPAEWHDWDGATAAPMHVESDTHAVPVPAHLSVARAGVRAALSSGAAVVVAFGAYACHRFDELPKAAPASYMGGIRCYRVDSGTTTTLVVEAPDPDVCAPATLSHVTRALHVAQQLADGAPLPLPPTAPPTWPLATAEPALSAEDAASLSKLLCHSLADEKSDPSLCASAAPSSLAYAWRSHLSPHQCRALISGWALASEAPTPSREGSPELPPQRVRGCTPSRTLADDLAMLAARAGCPCVVSVHDDPAWEDFPSQSGTDPSKSRYHLDFLHGLSGPVSSHSAPLTCASGPVLVRDHGHTHVYCLTVSSGNFLTRRAPRAGSASASASAACAPAFVGNCGTPSYTCPEQINGKKYVGSSADVWSLGVILFAMLSGFLPFEAAGIPALFRKIKARQYRCPSYLSREATDLIERMLTLDPEKRASIAELRNHPWVLMEYSELAGQIEGMPVVTPEMVAEARAVCMAVGDEQAQAAAAAAAAATAASSQAQQTRSNKYAHHKSNSVAVSGSGSSSVSRALALPSQSADSLTSGSTSASPVPDECEGRDGSSSADRDFHAGGGGGGGPYAISASSSASSASAAMVAGMRPRERGASVSLGIGGGVGMGIGMGIGGMGKGAPLIPGGGGTAKGFRDLRNGGGNGGPGDRYSPSFGPMGSAATGSGGATAAVPGKGRSMSIFDKLSVRVTDSGASSIKHGEILSAGAVGSAQPAGHRYPRFSPPTSAPGDESRVRFPPIGASPSISPSLLEAAAGGGGGVGTKGATSRATTSHGGREGRVRRPSEFSSGGAAIPSYMQPTENATNHLLASEREEREKAEAESGGVTGGRVRGRTSIIHASPPAVGIKPRDRLGLGDVNEDFYSHHGGHGGHGAHGAHPSAAAASAAARALVKTPRTRDIGGGGNIPAYMLETNSSRQRGGNKQTDL